MEGKTQLTQIQERNDQEGLVNFRTEEWRKEQLEACKGIVEEIFREVGVKIGDAFFVEVTEDYNPDKEDDYSLRIYIESSKVDYIRMTYRPLKNNVDWYKVSVNTNYRKQGIGTALEEGVEHIARMLGAHSLTLSNIVDSSLEYWRRKSGVVFDETGRNAIKQLP